MTDILLEGVRETIGWTHAKSPKNEGFLFNQVLENQSLSTDSISGLIETAPVEYGIRGASGIAHRIGESCFRSFIRNYGKQYLLTENSFRLMNSQSRILFGLEKLAEFADKNCGAQIRIYEDEKFWYWKVLATSETFNINPLYIPYTFGLLREFFSWTSGGRFYPMEESSNSRTPGILFQIAINKQPLGN